MQAIGAAVERAVDLCLLIEETYAGVRSEVTTFTMPLKDEILNENKEV